MPDYPEIPDDDSDFTPELGREILGMYQELCRGLKGEAVAFFNNWQQAETNEKRLHAALEDALRSSRKDFKAGPDGTRQHREAYTQQFEALEANPTTVVVGDDDRLLSEKAVLHALGIATLGLMQTTADRCLRAVRKLPSATQGIELVTCGDCTGSGYSGHPDSGLLCHACAGTGGVRGV